VEALLAGEVEICAASRPLTPAEVQALHDRFSSLGIRHLVAQDALSVYLNPDNPVRDLSLDQLGAIFRGEVVDWSEIGGHDQEIRVVVRPPNSGTHLFFKEHVLKGAEYSPRAITVARTVDVVRQVADDPRAVGYGGVAYGGEVVHCAVNGVAPAAAEVAAGSYPLTRYLHLVTRDAPRGEVKRFIDWCVGPGGQAVVADVGYLPLWPPH
jgi:phosphate transport system substrate-binding protein